MNLYKELWKPTGLKSKDWAKHRPFKQWGRTGRTGTNVAEGGNPVRKICIDCQKQEQQNSKTKRCLNCETSNRNRW